MPTIFPEMGGNTISAILLGNQRRLNEFWIACASSLPDGRHMVDIHT
jgi:hypothetical protein